MRWLQLEIEKKVKDTDALLRILEYLRSRSEVEAIALLGRVRMGESVESMVASLDSPSEVNVLE